MTEFSWKFGVALKRALVERAHYFDPMLRRHKALGWALGGGYYHRPTRAGRDYWYPLWEREGADESPGS